MDNGSSRPRVLLLGWEYAPRITGGLGTASVRLAHALAERVELSVIVPRLPDDEEEEDSSIPDFAALAAGDPTTTDALRSFPASSDEHVAPPPAPRPRRMAGALPPPLPHSATGGATGTIRRLNLPDGPMPGLRLTVLSQLTPDEVRAATAPSAPPRYEVFAQRVRVIPFGFATYADVPEVPLPAPLEEETEPDEFAAEPAPEDFLLDPAAPAGIVTAAPAGITEPDYGPGVASWVGEAPAGVPLLEQPVLEQPLAAEENGATTDEPADEKAPDEATDEAPAELTEEPEALEVPAAEPDPLSEALAPFWQPVLNPLTAASSNTEVVQFGRLAARLASGEALDVVYAHDWPTFLAGVEIRLEKRIPLVLHVHSTSWDRHGGKSAGWVFELERQAFRVADRVVAVSEYGARVLREHYGVDPARIRVVYHGLLADETDPRRWEARPAGPAPLVLFVGRLTAQKNPLGFVEVARHVLEAVPHARFAVAGDGPLRADMQAAAEAADIPADRFRLLGFLNDEAVRAVLGQAAAVCLPARSEPFGLAALEAAGAGVPLVLSATTGAAEVLTGTLTADWHNAAALAAHVITLLTDEPLRRRLVRENAAACRRLTWERAAAEVAQVIDEVVAEVRPQVER